MASKNKPNNAVVIDKCTQRLTALKHYVDKKAQIPIDGEQHKLLEVVAIYEKCLETRAALQTKRAEVKAALVARAEAEASRRAADRALKPWVVNTYGADSQASHDFGFPPVKSPVRTLASKVDAAVMAKATRQARHTMGPLQKEKVKGTMIVSTEPAEPAQPAPTHGAASGVTTTTSNGAAH
jgi:hypothetical protein